MSEKRIELHHIDPVEIFGVNDRLILRLGGYFPKLKVIARGNSIALKGCDKDIAAFEKALNRVIETRGKKRSLSIDDIDAIFESEPQERLLPEVSGVNSDIIVYGNDGKSIRARTKNQKKLVADYYKHDLIFALGPAGTGKTYTAIALAVRALKNREVKKLILTRPAVEAGERLGFLPGDLKEKLDPYLQPLYDALMDMIPSQKLKQYMEDGVIQIAPLAYMRGRTLESAFVILDEAQNTSFGQLKMFLTRMGENAKFIVTGDATQIDLPNREDSGLIKGISLLKSIKGISVINFTRDDIVRHPLVSKIVKAFEKFPDCTLTMVGFGELDKKLRSIAPKNVVFTGAVDNARLPEYYRKSDVLILPSYSETWGVVVEEALNNGIPAIISENVGCKGDVVVGGETGVIFSFGEPDGLVRAIERIRDIRLYDKISRNIRNIDFAGICAYQINCYI